MTTVTAEVELSTLECGACNVVFAMPTWMQRKRRQDGKDFWCPNGHCIAYADYEVARLRRQVDRLTAQLTHERDNLAAAERSNVALRGANTRLRTRARAGVCPCCHRTFQQLARHMANKHPDFDPEVADA